MSRLRETIFFRSGNFYRLERWNGDDRLVEIIGDPGEVTKVPAWGARWHYHRAIELTTVLRGTSTCFVADKLQRFSAGEIFILGENIPHYWHHPRGSEGISILWEFPAEHGIWELGAVKSLRLLEERALRGLGLSGTSGKRACRRVEGLTEMSGLQRLGGLFQLMHELLHADNGDVRFIAAQPFDLTGTNEREESIRRALSYIHANYREEIHLADLLNVTSMGRTTFTQQFQLSAKTCYTTYLNRVRLEAVCRELRSSSAPIGSVALGHGFTQISFFNRLFRREMKMSPKQYREHHLAARAG